MASWYGKRYHGQPTASGEIYDMYAMTAAHPTLPIPSYARVTNLRSGKSVVVPLPLISYGGTSLVSILFAMGILMSIHTHKRLVKS